jgi:hypothetical protein
MAWAIFTSMLLHLALVFGVTLYTWKTHRVVRHDVAMIMHGRIVAIQPADRQKSPVAILDVPAKPLPVDPQPHLAIARPQTTPDVPPTRVEDKVPEPKPPEFGGEMTVRYGVSVTETLFQRALPVQFERDLSNFPGFVRSTDLDERPEPIELVVPDVSSGIFAARISGAVTMALFVDEFGQVIEAIQVLSSMETNEQIPEIAIAMRQSKFTPGRLNGRAVRSVTFQIVRFGPQMLSPPVPAQPTANLP